MRIEFLIPEEVAENALKRVYGIFLDPEDAELTLSLHAGRVVYVLDDHLVYEGPHDLFAEKASAVVMALIETKAFTPNAAQDRPVPKVYVPDDDRLFWYETYSDFLLNRAPWDEFAQHSSSATIPGRFLSHRTVFGLIGPGVNRENFDIGHYRVTYGDKVVDDVLAFMKRFVVTM